MSAAGSALGSAAGAAAASVVPPATSPAAAPISWRETRERLRRDRARLRAFLDAEPGPRPRWLITTPAYQGVLLHRVSYYCFAHGHPLLARLFWHVNLLLTGVDVAVLSDIGGGMVMRHPALVALATRIGRDCTFHGAAGIGGGSRRRTDIGAGPGLPVVGDAVEVRPGALVLGPVRIGDHAVLGANTMVSADVPPGVEVPDGVRWIHAADARDGGRDDSRCDARTAEGGRG